MYKIHSGTKFMSEFKELHVQLDKYLLFWVFTTVISSESGEGKEGGILLPTLKELTELIK